MMDTNFNVIKDLSLKLQFGKGQQLAKGGSIDVPGNIAAGHGGVGDGGDATFLAGDGYNGASGGDLNLKPGNYTAGNGGNPGKGGSLIFKAGDAK